MIEPIIDTTQANVAVELNKSSDPNVADTTNTVVTNTTHTLTNTINNLPQLAPDWTNRRKIIISTVKFCGVMMASIVWTVCIILIIDNLFLHNVSTDKNLTDLLGTALYAMTFLSTSVIGSYCFSASWEAKDFRNKITDLIGKSV